MKPSLPRLAGTTAALAALAIAPLAQAASGPLAPPEQLDEARKLVASMVAGERGPYSRIRWYCKDGTVLPPEPFACRDHGGGRQHAEYSADRARLLALGIPVGTILSATPFADLWQPSQRSWRLRALPVERYLVESEDGWVLRRARNYRGRVQVEDEEAAGRELLLELLVKPGALESDFLLVRELVRALPHASGGDRTRTARRLAQEVAEADRSFERLRVAIHTTPGPRDIAAVEGWIRAARGRGAAPAAIETATTLVAELRRLYADPAAAIAALRRRLPASTAATELDALLAASAGAEPAARARTLAAALALTRSAASAAATAPERLAWLDLGVELEGGLRQAAFAQLATATATRGELLGLARALVDAAWGAGLFSDGERGALLAPLSVALAGTQHSEDRRVEPQLWLDAVATLRRAGGWALGTVRWTFAEPLVRYGAVEPAAARFVDEVVRSSALLPLGEVVLRLSLDAETVSGRVHQVLGAPAGGLLGLNPGVAIGPLQSIPAEGAAPTLDRGSIVLLPETVSELVPVAGILTASEGNLLSHVQMLARNLGIPNASLGPAAVARLADREGQQLVVAVGSDGSVVVESPAALPESLRERLAPANRAQTVRFPAPVPDLSQQRLLPLAELSAELAGRVVGPKAANLGELARLFPGRVAPAIGIPFGLFEAHVGAGSPSPRARLEAAFAAHRAGRLDDAALAAEVDAVRATIAAIRLSPGLRAELAALIESELGGAARGIFVRSDTNVEDLPGFTGAGLNETLPNLVDLEAVLAGISRVWASPFRERPMAWRARVLERPEDVYTSVLLMQSVPSTKSGVLVTRDLIRRRPGLTVATAWGVGGAVDGEAAETVVLEPEGGVLLAGEAKAPYQRHLAAGGGVEWIPAPSGPVLTADEQAALRRLADELAVKLEPATDENGASLPWDVEFGFVDGELRLFQIRALVERGPALADRVVDAFREPSTPARSGPLDLDAPLEASTAETPR